MREPEIDNVKPIRPGAPATERQMSLVPPGGEAAARAVLADKLGTVVGRSRAQHLTERFGAPLEEPGDAAA